MGLAAIMARGALERTSDNGHEAYLHAGFAAKGASAALPLAKVGARSTLKSPDERSGLLAAFDASRDCIPTCRKIGKPTAIFQSYCKLLARWRASSKGRMIPFAANVYCASSAI